MLDWRVRIATGDNVVYDRVNFVLVVVSQIQI